MEQFESLVGPKEVAAYLKMSMPTVRRLAREGKIPAIEFPGSGGERSQWRFYLSDIEKHLKARAKGVASEGLVSAGLPVSGQAHQAA